VRNLRVLDRLFFRPLMETGVMAKDLAERLFPNLDEVLALHNQYNQKMNDRAKAGFPVGSVGDMLSEMV
jgi:Rho guanine nucleotide exchange factor 12